MNARALTRLSLVLVVLASSCTPTIGPYSTEFSQGILEIEGETGAKISASENALPNPSISVDFASGESLFLEYTEEGHIKQMTLLNLNDPIKRKADRYWIGEKLGSKGLKAPMVIVRPLEDQTHN